MELWIRSQDKDILTKVEKLELIYDCLCSDEVQLIHIDSSKERLGSYSTKERALEVLDEIQVFLTKTDIVGNRWYEFSVFEMPKD